MHIYLIGYRGCGKSTVGRGLAAELGREVVDTDDLIEQAAGRSIAEIFASEGEAGFRDRESQAIASVASSSATSPAVVALGGGAVLRQSNREVLSRTGQCIWLQGDPQLLYARIVGDAHSGDRRPDLTDQGGYAEVVEILAIREPIYRQLAQRIVNTDGKTPDEVKAEILLWVNSPA
ncbi:shikimate kinase [Aureliella helgolandensis]|uniref:Shikimate kinase n=1 Tax=Aureliella helgolandensis TaxID=2527968 RepID=A0A518G1L0_9BACT|nr:shikimate kinase [Aureliella helgolandensis]QDV22444.1 Shikimate kinase 2 [Aureliella helgolandensis]